MSGLIDLSGNNSCSDTVKNILCTPTKTMFFNEIDLSGGITFVLQNTFNYTSDMIGYTQRSTGTNTSITPTASTVYEISSFTLDPGIYIIYLFTNMVLQNTSGTVNSLSVGLTLNTASFTGGTGEIKVVTNTKYNASAAAAGRIVGKTMTTLNVPSSASYHFVGRVNATTQPTWDRTVSYCIYTRIA